MIDVLLEAGVSNGLGNLRQLDREPICLFVFKLGLISNHASNYLVPEINQHVDLRILQAQLLPYSLLDETDSKNELRKNASDTLLAHVVSQNLLGLLLMDRQPALQLERNHSLQSPVLKSLHIPLGFNLFDFTHDA